MIQNEDVNLSRAMLAVIIKELDKQILQKKFSSRRDFALKCFKQANSYSFFSCLMLGRNGAQGVPKIDIETALAMTTALNLNFAETIVAAKQLIKEGTFPFGKLANKTPLKKAIDQANPESAQLADF